MFSGPKVAAFFQSAQESLQEGIKEHEKKLSDAMDNMKQSLGMDGHEPRKSNSSIPVIPSNTKVEALKAMVPSMAGDGELAEHLTHAANLGPVVGPILSKAAKSKELALPPRETVDELCWAPYLDGRWYRAVSGTPFRWAVASDDPSLPLESLCPEGGVPFARSAWFAARKEPLEDDMPEEPSLSLIESKSSKIEKVKNALLVLQPSDIDLDEPEEPSSDDLETLKRKQEEAHESLRDGNMCIGLELQKVQQNHSAAKEKMETLGQDVANLMFQISQKQEELNAAEAEVHHFQQLEARLLENLQTATDNWTEKIDRMEEQTWSIQQRKEWLDHLQKAKEMLTVSHEEEMDRQQYLLDLQVSRYRTCEALCAVWEAKLSVQEQTHGDDSEAEIAQDYATAIWKSIMSDVESERQTLPEDITAQLAQLGKKYKDFILVRLESIRSRFKELQEDAAE